MPTIYLKMYCVFRTYYSSSVQDQALFFHTLPDKYHIILSHDTSWGNLEKTAYREDS